VGWDGWGFNNIGYSNPWTPSALLSKHSFSLLPFQMRTSRCNSHAEKAPLPEMLAPRRHHCQRCSACPRSRIEISNCCQEWSIVVRDLTWPEVTPAETSRSQRRSLDLFYHTLKLRPAPSPFIAISQTNRD
jgi:hypothetical protein